MEQQEVGEKECSLKDQEHHKRCAGVLLYREAGWRMYIYSQSGQSLTEPNMLYNPTHAWAHNATRCLKSASNYHSGV